jgi:hypothetical protein
MSTKDVNGNGTYTAAKTAAMALYQGANPADVLRDPSLYGGWWSLFGPTIDAFQSGGADAVVRIFEVNARGNDAVAALLNDAKGALSQDTRPKTLAEVPPLPDHLSAIASEQLPCAAWLDAYIEFARQAAPMTPRSFHEAAGLFLVSTTIARRLVYSTGVDGIFPNVFMLMIADPAAYKKTTGLRVAQRVLVAAGLEHFILDETVTPQSLSEELSLRTTPDVEHDEQRREEWLIERAFAAQRAWMLDEAAGLFDSFEREYNTGLHLLILRLFDCVPELRERTMGRGRTTVRNAYLSILGASTPETIQKHLTSKMLWGSGLWSRFILLVPDTESVYAPRPPKMTIPPALVARLQRIHQLFPVPEARWVQERNEETDRPKGRPYVSVHGEQPPAEVYMSAEVETILDTYNRVVGYEMAKSKALEPTLRSAYDRLALHLLKVSMILAVIDAKHLPIIVELRHVARAIRIVERWRKFLHTAWNQVSATDELQLTRKIELYLEKHQLTGLTARELCQATHTPSKEVHAALDLLKTAGRVDADWVSKKRQVWRLAKGEV